MRRTELGQGVQSGTRLRFWKDDHVTALAFPGLGLGLAFGLEAEDGSSPACQLRTPVPSLNISI